MLGSHVAPTLKPPHAEGFFSFPLALGCCRTPRPAARPGFPRSRACRWLPQRPTVAPPPGQPRPGAGSEGQGDQDCGALGALWPVPSRPRDPGRGPHAAPCPPTNTQLSTEQPPPTLGEVPAHGAAPAPAGAQMGVSTASPTTELRTEAFSLPSCHRGRCLLRKTYFYKYFSSLVSVDLSMANVTLQSLPGLELPLSPGRGLCPDEAISTSLPATFGSAALSATCKTAPLARPQGCPSRLCDPDGPVCPLRGETQPVEGSGWLRTL